MKQLFFCCAVFFVFEICSKELEWEQTKFIWSAGIEIVADIGPQKKPKDFFAEEPIFDSMLYSNIQNGDIVWVPARFLTAFASEVLPNITSSFVLLVNDSRGSDESFPSDCLSPLDLEKFIENPYVAHIFAQNCDYQGNSLKISHFPIGIDFHTVAYKGESGGWGVVGSPIEQENVLIEIINSSKPTNLRKKLAFVDFHHSDTMRAGFKRYLQFGEDRKSIFQKLVGTNLIEYSNWMDRYSLWHKKSQYAFSISPHGNGLDCHRTWEDLALGCIVIVKSSPLDSLYEGLPVVIINDWSEVTEENLDKWLEKYGDVKNNSSYREKLSHEYWYKKILEQAKPLRK